MAKMNWSRAANERRSFREAAKESERRANRILAGSEAPKVNRRKAKPRLRYDDWLDRIERQEHSRPTERFTKQKRLRSGWPRVVTTGPLTTNGLTIIVLRNRAHAIEMGFGWVTTV